MIKRIIAVAFFYTLTNLYAKEIDFRQVIFGNAYENIIEVESNDFFNQFPETRNIEDYGQGEIINQIKSKEKHFPNDLATSSKLFCDIEFSKKDQPNFIILPFLVLKVVHLIAL